MSSSAPSCCGTSTACGTVGREWSETEESYTCIQIDAPGGYDALKLRTLHGTGVTGPNVTLGAPENVQIEVRFTGINYADVCIRWGLYESAKKFVGFPITPGFEFSGVVLDPGTNKDLKVGQWVVAVSMFGGYSTKVVVPPSQVIPFDPDQLDPSVASSLPCAALTAWYALFVLSTPGTSPGGSEGAGRRRRILVHSAAGGVGSMICRLAKLPGCNYYVVGIVGAASKVEKLQEWECCDVIISKEECGTRGVDFWKEVDRLSNDVGFDAVFDANGPSTLTQSYDHLRPEGRLITYGFHSMLPKEGGRLNPCQWVRMAYDYYFKQKTFDAMNMVPENRSVLGFNLSFLFERTDLFKEVMTKVMRHTASGKIKTKESDVTLFQLGDVGKAHAAIESGLTTGKLVLSTSDELAKRK